MPRPRKIQRNIPVKIRIPETLYGAVALELHSELKGRIPYGDFSNVVATLLKEWLAARGINHEGSNNGDQA